MKTEKQHIRIGYFADFKGEDSILISADIEGLLELEDLFLKLADGLSSFDLLNLKLLDKSFRLKLSAFNDTKNVGLIQTSKDSYEWRATSEKWNQFREKLTTLYRNCNDGHHYLDCEPADNKDLQVVFSWNEYPLTFWKKHNTENKNAL
ncbi:MAG: hypothetical protein V4572_13125 [Bacteroidota bacterium]